MSEISLEGVTEDGKPVLSGLFYLVGTKGLPLDVLVEEVHERGVTIDMMDFIAAARKDGWKDRTILAKFRETRYGADEVFISRLERALAA